VPGPSDPARPVATSGGSRPATVDRADAPISGSHPARTLDLFLEASLTMLDPEVLRGPQGRLVTSLFGLGAAQSLAEKEQVPDLSLAGRVLARLGTSAQETTRILAARAEARPGSPVARIMAEGADAFTIWLHGKDNNAGLRLGQLLAEWGRAPASAEDT
jgi:hypothetical protein